MTEFRIGDRAVLFSHPRFAKTVICPPQPLVLLARERFSVTVRRGACVLAAGVVAIVARHVAAMAKVIAVLTIITVVLPSCSWRTAVYQYR